MWPYYTKGAITFVLTYFLFPIIFQYLDISGNQIKEFNIRKQLQSLLSLKLSFNLLKQIPKTINNQMFPVLRVLILDGNPIETIYFEKPISLEILSLAEINNVKVIEKRAFTNVEPRIVEGYEENCFSLTLSNCPSLEMISDGAFEGTSLCMVSFTNHLMFPCLLKLLKRFF